MAWAGNQLFLGNATPDEILSAAASMDTKKDREQHCEAYFYLGEYYLIAGHRSEAERSFQQSVDTGVSTFIEYAGAKNELKGLTHPPL